MKYNTKYRNSMFCIPFGHIDFHNVAVAYVLGTPTFTMLL